MATSRSIKQDGSGDSRWVFASSTTPAAGGRTSESVADDCSRANESASPQSDGTVAGCARWRPISVLTRPKDGRTPHTRTARVARLSRLINGLSGDQEVSRRRLPSDASLPAPANCFLSPTRARFASIRSKLNLARFAGRQPRSVRRTRMARDSLSFTSLPSANG